MHNISLAIILIEGWQPRAKEATGHTQSASLTGGQQAHEQEVNSSLFFREHLELPLGMQTAAGGAGRRHWDQRQMQAGLEVHAAWGDRGVLGVPEEAFCATVVRAAAWHSCQVKVHQHNLIAQASSSLSRLYPLSYYYNPA